MGAFDDIRNRKLSVPWGQMLTLENGGVRIINETVSEYSEGLPG